MHKASAQRGFTLLELMVTIAVVGILTAIAYPLYSRYQERARASDVVVKYDAIRTGVGAEMAQGPISRCADLIERLGNANLNDAYVQLNYGFEAMAGGYRPVLNVCAKADVHGRLGVQVAHGAYETLAKIGRVENGAVLTETIVSFAAPLSASAQPLCAVPVTGLQPACGAAAPAADGPCGPNTEIISFSPGQGATIHACVRSCQPGQVRDPNNPRWCVAAAGTR
jgi:prepilin-type N-terminal cleavage/methylation domain-containing protein